MEIEEKLFNPYAQRNTEKPLSFIKAIIHLLSAIFGRGLMTLPFAIQKGGLIISFTIAPLLWLLYPYCMHNLIELKHKIAKIHKKPYLSYPKAVNLCFMDGPAFLKPLAKYFSGLVNIFIAMIHILSCFAYTSYVGFIISKATGWEKTENVIGFYKLCLIVPLSALTFIESLRAFTYISIMANLSTLACIVIVFIIIFKEGLKAFSTSNALYFGTFIDIAKLLSVSMYSLEPLGIYIAVEENMKNPASFHGLNGVLSIANIIPLIVFTTIGLLGTYRFKNVGLNIKFGNDRLEFYFLIMYGFSVFLTYPLYYYVVMEILWDCLSRNAHDGGDSILWAKQISRIAVNVLIVVSGLVFPFLELMISIFNAILIPLLCLVLPAVMELIYSFGQKKESIRYIVVKDTFIIIVGFIAFVVSLSSNILIFCCT